MVAQNLLLFEVDTRWVEISFCTNPQHLHPHYKVLESKPDKGEMTEIVCSAALTLTVENTLSLGIQKGELGLEHREEILSLMRNKLLPEMD